MTGRAGRPLRGVLFDFYGTLAESSWQPGWLEEELARHGVGFDPAVVRRWVSDAWDGQEHVEHSVSEEAYNTWLHERWRSMMRELGAVEGDLDDVVAAVLSRRDQWAMQPYPETIEVLTELRERGLRLGVCSNWDWDLDDHLAACGLAELFDARVSSAWVGARKPHRRVFDAALEALGTTAADTLYVGDNWVADVEGGLAVGLRVVHVWRPDRDLRWLPAPPEAADGVVRVPDLRGLLELA